MISDVSKEELALLEQKMNVLRKVQEDEVFSFVLFIPLSLHTVSMYPYCKVFHGWYNVAVKDLLSNLYRLTIGDR